METTLRKMLTDDVRIKLCGTAEFGNWEGSEITHTYIVLRNKELFMIQAKILLNFSSSHDVNILRLFLSLLSSPKTYFLGATIGGEVTDPQDLHSKIFSYRMFQMQRENKIGKKGE